MNKEQIIDLVAAKTLKPKKDIAEIVDATIDTLKQSFRDGEKVELRGFGVFKIRDTKARISRNPRNGATAQVHPGKRIFFKAGIGLRTELKGKAGE